MDVCLISVLTNPTRSFSVSNIEVVGRAMTSEQQQEDVMYLMRCATLFILLVRGVHIRSLQSFFALLF